MVGTGKIQVLTAVTFRIQRVKIPSVTLKTGITLLCRPEPTLSSFWDWTGFYFHCRAVEFSRIFKTIFFNIRETGITWLFPGFFFFFVSFSRWSPHVYIGLRGR